VLPLGLPDLPFHLRLDALSASFLVLLGSASAAISLYSSGYFRAEETTAPGLICFQYHAFLAAMGLVLVADDAYVFMVAWETMALASFFLVTTDHRVPEIRRAAFCTCSSRTWAPSASCCASACCRAAAATTRSTQCAP
jgi:formate hydrogenlyase subunit 3/multisubunit Na+/H+ antiporter MnhD subunit